MSFSPTSFPHKLILAELLLPSGTHIDYMCSQPTRDINLTTASIYGRCSFGDGCHLLSCQEEAPLPNVTNSSNFPWRVSDGGGGKGRKQLMTIKAVGQQSRPCTEQATEGSTLVSTWGHATKVRPTGHRFPRRSQRRRRCSTAWRGEGTESSGSCLKRVKWVTCQKSRPCGHN